METVNLVAGATAENGSIIIPTPLDSHILVKNPFYGKDAEMDKLEKELEKMPEKDRDEFRKKHFYDVWHNLEVVKTGASVLDVAVGDTLISTAHAMQNVVVLCDERFLMSRRSNFIGKW